MNERHVGSVFTECGHTEAELVLEQSLGVWDRL
jgi:hypothetical protein